jgi:hypothetical protein
VTFLNQLTKLIFFSHEAHFRKSCDRQGKHLGIQINFLQKDESEIIYVDFKNHFVGYQLQFSTTTFF